MRLSKLIAEWKAGRVPKYLYSARDHHRQIRSTTFDQTIRHLVQDRRAIAAAH